ncbi:MAG: hypothetical protein ABF521_01570 [Acetobacter orientalis]|uniref:hypothetical protein n=1 Tax=Acetobacter orientalis TaxID=146474 RepID=UPI0039EC0FBD
MITKRKLLTMLSASCLIPLTACSQGRTRGGWHFYKGNPVIGGQYGTCFDPYVIFDNSILKMWFSWRPQHGIAYCESYDGITWSSPKLVLGVDPNEIGQLEINRCCVLKRGNGYHMWFTGQSKTGSSIYYATSTDGLTWSKVQPNPVLTPELPWEKTSVMCPDVILESTTGLLRMYYSAGEQYEPDGIGLATSTDGKNWEKLPKAIFTSDPKHQWEKAKVTACNIHYVNGWYYMFYIGFADVDHASICLARSKNGIDQWERHSSNPILEAPGKSHFFEWDRDAIYKPAAVIKNNNWMVFFNARRHHTEQIGMATHNGPLLDF